MGLSKGTGSNRGIRCLGRGSLKGQKVSGRGLEQKTNAMGVSGEGVWLQGDGKTQRENGGKERLLTGQHQKH